MFSGNRNLVLILGVVFTTATIVLYVWGRAIWVPVYFKMVGKRTVADAVTEYEKGAIGRMLPYFAAAQITYPPSELVLLVSKRERVLEVWGRTSSRFRFIREYPIQKMSGTSGPKLREGDRQVPEGLYKIVGLNPNSAFHLSLKLNYPNEFDLLHAEAEGRYEPGSNIFIHGKSSSIGCLAMGDTTVEELFVLVEGVGLDAVRVVIAPHDPRRDPLSVQSPLSPPWTSDLYRMISNEFAKFSRAQISQSSGAEAQGRGKDLDGG